MPWGSSVFARIIAINIYGQSAESPVGNGAIIIRAPDQPTSITEIIQFRNATTIAISWLPGQSNGGTPIIDYRITYSTGG